MTTTTCESVTFELIPGNLQGSIVIRLSNIEERQKMLFMDELNLLSRYIWGLGGSGSIVYNSVSGVLFQDEDVQENIRRANLLMNFRMWLNERNVSVCSKNLPTKPLHLRPFEKLDSLTSYFLKNHHSNFVSKTKKEINNMKTPTSARGLSKASDLESLNLDDELGNDISDEFIEPTLDIPELEGVYIDEDDDENAINHQLKLDKSDISQLALNGTMKMERLKSLSSSESIIPSSLEPKKRGRKRKSLLPEDMTKNLDTKSSTMKVKKAGRGRPSLSPEEKAERLRLAEQLKQSKKEERLARKNAKLANAPIKQSRDSVVKKAGRGRPRNTERNLQPANNIPDAEPKKRGRKPKNVVLMGKTEGVVSQNVNHSDGIIVIEGLYSIFNNLMIQIKPMEKAYEMLRSLKGRGRKGFNDVDAEKVIKKIEKIFG